MLWRVSSSVSRTGASYRRHSRRRCTRTSDGACIKIAGKGSKPWAMYRLALEGAFDMSVVPMESPAVTPRRPRVALVTLVAIGAIIAGGMTTWHSGVARHAAC